MPRTYPISGVGAGNFLGMTPQLFLDLMGSHTAKRFRKGILPFVDLFAGAGGTSTGALLAMRELGLNVQLAAVNHWDCAISTHELNHEGHLHFCTGVDRVDVNDLLAESDSDGIFGLWGSPSCLNFSAARGGVPINDQDRSTCWALVKWLRTKRAIHCWVENVPQFVDYGPLTQKRDKEGILVFLKKDEKGMWREVSRGDMVRQKGSSHRKWLKHLDEAHGLKPAMVPDRKRKGLYFKKWVRAIKRLGYDFEWRVLNAADYGAPTKRLRFIAQAVKRSSGRRIVWPNPTHVEPDANGSVPAGLLPWRTAREIINWSDLGESIFARERPLADKTIDRIAVGLIKFGLTAAVVKLRGTGTANSVDLPLGTVTGGGLNYALMTPAADVLSGAGSNVDGTVQQIATSLIVGAGGPVYSAKPKSVDAPMGTIVGENHRGVANAFIIGAGGPARGGEPRSVDKPLNVVLARRTNGLVSSEPLEQVNFLVPNFGERPTQTPRTHSVDAPIPAVTSHGAGGLVSGEFNSFLVVSNHGNGPEGDKANLRRAKSVDRPLDTVTGSNSLAVISGNASEAAAGEEPAEVNDWQELSQAIKAAVKRCRRERSYRPLIRYMGLVFRLEIRFRMLHWRELARAQSFPDEYRFNGTDGEKVKQIGNAVPPALARAIVKASVSQNPDVGLLEAAYSREMKVAC